MHSFELLRAADPSAAIAAASRSHTAQQGASVRFLAGGTTLVDLMKLLVETPDQLVDINRLGLDGIERAADGGLRIGATARNTDLAHHPIVQAEYAALSQAILAGASTQLRNAATTAGNLLQRTRCVYFRDIHTPCNKREPGSGCSAIGGANRMLAILGTSEHCIASNPSDMAVAMMIYDAVVHTRGARGERQVAIADFFLLPGDTPDRENVLQPGELVTHVTLPPPEAGARAAYLKLRDRASYEFALVSVAASVTLAEGRIASARFALGGVGTRPWRVQAAEASLAGRSPTEEAFRHAADLALAGARPQSQNGFKVELARRCVVRTLHQLTR
ncbi:MAG TPA: xanthine dehydrogenase family protein subunit M [Acetobacteraceae bacterium]|nr:xanthine dehydrogenase family protein subunit M [Acetobacteraceae bacterium]